MLIFENKNKIVFSDAEHYKAEYQKLLQEKQDSEREISDLSREINDLQNANVFPKKKKKKKKQRIISHQ